MSRCRTGGAVLVLESCALRVVVLSPAGVEGEVGLDGRIRWRVDVSQSISQQTDCQFAEQWVGESRVETGRGGDRWDGWSGPNAGCWLLLMLNAQMLLMQAVRRAGGGTSGQAGQGS